LVNRLPDLEINTTLALGIDPDWVEAIALAWLAKHCLEGVPGNHPAVTGAQQVVILDGICT
jgi:anhydro-N-acetylmuramic acid kinase